MIEIRGARFPVLWDYDAVVMPTNGLVLGTDNYLEDNWAYKLTPRVPKLASLIGEKITKERNVVHVIAQVMTATGKTPPWVVTFPIRPKGAQLPSSWDDDTINACVIDSAKGLYTSKGKLRGAIIPGNHIRAMLDLITKSARALFKITDKNQWTKVAMPQIAAGERSWEEEVKPRLEAAGLDDRFHIFMRE